MTNTSAAHKNNFNFLRLLGAAFVIISHTYDVVGKSSQEPLNRLTNGGIEFSGLGLAIFFFISGYFITRSAYTSTTLFLFIEKRILRIYPALIVLVLLSVFIIAPFFTTLPLHIYFTDKDSWLYLFTATGFRIRMTLPGIFDTPSFFIKAFNASLWSIELELQLYISIVFFLLLGILKNKKVFTYSTATIILLCFITLAFKTGLSFEWMRELNLVAIFYIGSFIYTTGLNEKHLKNSLLLSGIFYILFLRLKLPHFNPTVLLLIILSLCVYFIGFTRKIKMAVNVDISYGLYIYAFPVQQIVFQLSNFNNLAFLNLIGTFIIIVPVAIASWHLIEKPFMAYKNKIR